MIRAAHPSDAAAIAAFWNPYIRDTAITFTAQEKTADDIAAMIRDRQTAGHGFLVADQGGIKGFASYSQFRGGPGYARSMEHTIILHPAAAGLGIGTALMTALQDHARQAGAHCLIAGVSAENPAGRAFHARIGFAEIATLPQVGYKFGRFMDLVLMQKFL